MNNRSSKRTYNRTCAASVTHRHADMAPANWHEQHGHLGDSVCLVIPDVSQNDNYEPKQDNHVQVQSEID